MHIPIIPIIPTIPIISIILIIPILPIIPILSSKNFNSNKNLPQLNDYPNLYANNQQIRGPIVSNLFDKTFITSKVKFIHIIYVYNRRMYRFWPSPLSDGCILANFIYVYCILFIHPENQSITSSRFNKEMQKKRQYEIHVKSAYHFLLFWPRFNFFFFFFKENPKDKRCGRVHKINQLFGSLVLINTERWNVYMDLCKWVCCVGVHMCAVCVFVCICVYGALYSHSSRVLCPDSSSTRKNRYTY